jgi:two-component system cell cycle response regulator
MMNQAALTVLLVEDNPGDVRLIRELLAAAGPGEFELIVVGRLAEALKHLSAGGIQVVLLDLSLPDSRGLNTFTTLKASEPDAPVVILTGQDDEGLSMIAAREGAQDYLIKGSVSGRGLARTIRYALERHRLMMELHTRSLVDPLTQLYNRRAFLALAERQLRLADRTGRGLLLMFVDVDNLKQVNDSFGHSAGDEALQEVAEVLRASLRGSDIIARLGGDEFALLAVEANDEGVEALMDRLGQNLLNRAQAGANHPYRLALSVGVARYDRKQPRSIDELLAEADAHMYDQKRATRQLKPEDGNPPDLDEMRP